MSNKSCLLKSPTLLRLHQSAFVGETGCSFQTHVLLLWHGVSSCWDCSSPWERKSEHCHPLHQNHGTEQTQGKGQAPDLCLSPRWALSPLALMAGIPQQVWAPGECSDSSVSPGRHTTARGMRKGLCEPSPTLSQAGNMFQIPFVKGWEHLLTG